MWELHTQHPRHHVRRLSTVLVLLFVSLAAVVSEDAGAGGAPQADGPHPLEAAVGVLRSFLSPSANNPAQDPDVEPGPLLTPDAPQQLSPAAVGPCATSDPTTCSQKGSTAVLSDTHEINPEAPIQSDSPEVTKKIPADIFDISSNALPTSRGPDALEVTDEHVGLIHTPSNKPAELSRTPGMVSVEFDDGTSVLSMQASLPRQQHTLRPPSQPAAVDEAAAVQSLADSTEVAREEGEGVADSAAEPEKAPGAVVPLLGGRDQQCATSTHSGTGTAEGAAPQGNVQPGIDVGYTAEVSGVSEQVDTDEDSFVPVPGSDAADSADDETSPSAVDGHSQGPGASGAQNESTTSSSVHDMRDAKNETSEDILSSDPLATGAAEDTSMNDTDVQGSGAREADSLWGTAPYPNWRLLRDLDVPEVQVTFLLEDPAEAEVLMAPADSKPQKKQPTSIPTPEEYSKALEERVKAQAVKQDAAAAGDSAQADSPAESEDARPKRTSRRRKINLAAASDGATILSSSKLKKVERAIDNDVDSFLKTDCKDNRWLIIELSQLGRVEQVEVTMKELYSCRIRDFLVKGRRADPRKDGGDYRDLFDGEGWQLLGNFTGENKKGTQTFKVKKQNHQLVKFVLIQVLTHWGNEPVCAVNTIRIYGVSAAQDLEDTLSTLTVPPPVAAAIVTPPILDPLLPDLDLPQNVVLTSSSSAAAAANPPSDPSSEVPNITSPDASHPSSEPGGGANMETAAAVASGESAEEGVIADESERACMDVSQEEVGPACKPTEPEPTVSADQPSAAKPIEPPLGSDADIHIPAVVPAKLVSEGGSLYDAIKLEILSLKLNQTLLWGYVRELQAALVQRTMELAEDIDTSEAGVAAVKARIEEVPKMMQASLSQQMSQLLELELKSLRSSIHQCNSALAAGRQREVGMALWASAGGGLAALAAVNGGRKGQLRQAVLLLAVVNGLLGTVLVNLKPLQQLLSSFRANEGVQQLVGLVAGGKQ